MRQLIARVDDALHARLKQRAKDEARSLNSLIVEALEAAIEHDSREDVRERARRLGLLAPGPAQRPNAGARRRLIAKTKGAGPAASEALSANRRQRG